MNDIITELQSIATSLDAIAQDELAQHVRDVIAMIRVDVDISQSK